MVGRFDGRGLPFVLRLTVAAALLLVVVVLFIGPFHSDKKNELQSRVELRSMSEDSEANSVADALDPVPLEFFVMSRCPDAIYCEQFYEPLVKGPLASLMEVTMNYIGRDDGSSLTCPHGPAECQGNIAQLCARRLSPANWYDYVMCMAKDPRSIPENAMKCASAAAIAPEDLKGCMTGDLGQELLRDSFARTKSLGVTRSCTIYLGGELYCVRDGGQWQPGCKNYDMDLIIKDLCKLMKEANPAWTRFPAVCKDVSLTL